MFEHIFRIVIAKISILTLNRINATEPDSNFLVVKSHWSEKREVNYLSEEQVNEILKEIKRVHDRMKTSHQ